MTRPELPAPPRSARRARERALRAAAAVALLGGSLACESAEPTRLSEADVGTLSDLGAPDSGVRDTGAVDLGLADAGTMDSGPADLGLADSGLLCDVQTMSFEEFSACCEAIEWDIDRGCGVWGPPAPPAGALA